MGKGVVGGECWVRGWRREYELIKGQGGEILVRERVW